MEYDIHACQGRKKSHYSSLFAALLLLLGTATPFAGHAAVWLPEEIYVFELVNHQRAINGLDPLQQNDQLHEAAVSHSQSMADNGYFSHTTLVGGNGEGPAERILSTGYQFTVGGENIAAGHGRILGDPPIQFEPLDAAHHVMYGTADLDEYNAFFYDDNAYITNPVDSWDGVGVGVTGGEWDAWHEYRLTPIPCDYDGDGDVDGECSSDGGWMGSSGHRETILSDLFVDIGVGYVWDPDDTAPILWDQGEIPFPLNTYWTQDFASPVPLPGAFWLLASGLAGLIMLGRGRKTI
jgi:uncharacterized protein YkwD